MPSCGFVDLVNEELLKIIVVISQSLPTGKGQHIDAIPKPKVIKGPGIFNLPL